MFRIKEVKALANYKLWLRFEDGTEGRIDLSNLVGKGVFKEWLDANKFAKVSIGDSGQLLWGKHIDLCPDMLYMKVTGKKAEELFPLLLQESIDA